MNRRNLLAAASFVVVAGWKPEYDKVYLREDVNSYLDRQAADLRGRIKLLEEEFAAYLKKQGREFRDDNGGPSES
jgi:hypothetical protein